MYVYANSHGRSLKGYTEEGASFIPDSELFAQNVDVIFAAAMENQLNASTMEKVKAKLILEGANGPTDETADKYFEEHGIEVLPDVMSNVGGVVAPISNGSRTAQATTGPKTNTTPVSRKR